MRAKTIKRLAILIVVLSLVGGAAVIAQRWQIASLAHDVAEKAKLAEEQGDFHTAELLYWQHLANVPGDVDIQIKYANALLKGVKSPKRQLEALQIYTDILRRTPGREDVRRLRMALNVATGRLVGDTGAEADLKILLKYPANAHDGNLLFLMGRCREAAKSSATSTSSVDDADAEDAVKNYKEAIANHAPQEIEAYHRLATVLRDRLKKPAEAEKAVETMVTSDPKNYRVYLERGRYRLSALDPSQRKTHLAAAKDDFQTALRLAPNEPDVYLEMAKAVESELGSGAAQKILATGLQKAPASAVLYHALALLYARTGQMDKAIKTLEDGIQLPSLEEESSKSPVKRSDLRWFLANLLARRGDTSELLLQIKELEKINYNQLFIDYITAHYYINSGEFRKARRLLVPIESMAALPLHFKAEVNDLLARCYSQLGEPAMQQDAYRRAVRANPDDVTAKLGLIEHMAKQGEIEGAIKEYRALIKQAPQVRRRLAQLLIQRNRQRPLPQRDWTEVEALIDDAAKASPDSIEPVILRVDMYVAQNKLAAARDELEKARSRFPKSVRIWIVQAKLMGSQNQINEALSLLDQAQKQLDDSVDLRLQRAELLVIKGGPHVNTDINNLAQGADQFSKEDRRELLNALAIELIRLRDLQGASRLWSQLAEQEPNDVDLRLNLLNLMLEPAFLTMTAATTATAEGALQKVKTEIEKVIKNIEGIEGNEAVLSRFCQVQYLIWQARQAGDKDPQEALRLRTAARVLLSELISRRGDWPQIPLAQAQLEEQELLAQPGLKEDEKLAKEESLLRYYRRAIDLGHRSPPIVRRAMQLLYKNGKGSEALDLLSTIPIESQLAGDMGRQAALFAVENRDFQQAEEIARRAVAANPGDFQERQWLVEILRSSGHLPEAETELRKAVDLVKRDPIRWIALVRFMVLTKQMVKAEQAVREAEVRAEPIIRDDAATEPKVQALLGLAQCCALVGRNIEAGSNDGANKETWFGAAKNWYEKAQAAKPGDISVMRQLTEFFVNTNQIDKAESQLAAIVKDRAGAESKDTKAWARRNLASIYIATKRARLARDLFMADQAGTTEQGDKAVEDPDELRVLARVLEAQKNDADRRNAIEILESLASKNLAKPDDQLLLAQLYEISGDWPKAREKYHELELLTDNVRDLETLSHRPFYLAQFADSVLRHRQSDDKQALADAQRLVDKIKQLQPDAVSTLRLQVEVHRASNQAGKAVELIQAFADRPNQTPLTPKTLADLADMAEKLGRFDVAEQLYGRGAALPSYPQGKIELAKFLSRRGSLKQALDVCEPLWTNTREPEAIARACMDVVIASKKDDPAHKDDPAQLDRIAGWMEEALKGAQAQNPRSATILLLGLGNLREQQERYQDAEALYQRAIEKGQRDATSSNNLAWLMVLNEGKGKGKAALEYINRSIELEGRTPEFLDTRGVIYLTIGGETQRAIDDLEKAVDADPAPAKLFHLAQAYYQANDKEKAKRYLEMAKTKGLPTGLHQLEQPAYRKLLHELGFP